MFLQLVSLLAWFAPPVALLCVIDDWFFRPRRQIAASPNPPLDPPVIRIAYMVLPVLVISAVIRLLVSERLDFSLVLVIIAAVSGVVWAIDSLLFRPSRVRRAAAAGKDFASIPEPGTVDYARSFFPVAVVVLLLRSFLFEPFRIPSDSMMPTLLDGDFIVVNKFAYGLRMPVTNTKFVGIGEPQRGDVVVFRYPPDPSINYIKRLVGLPGDRIQVVDDRIIVNGVPAAIRDLGRFNDGCYVNLHLVEEKLGEKWHQSMFCHTPGSMGVLKLPSCDRDLPGSYVCDEVPNGYRDNNDSPVFDVPAGKYLMIGDNRDNSADGREFGFVPESYLVGKATRIWFNWDLQRSGGPKWDRIGSRIE